MPPQISKQTNKTIPRQTQTSKSDDVWGQIDTIRMLLYGESGTGKTTFWATFPGPILALLCSGGRKPGELRSINTPEYRKKITPRVLTSVEDVRKQTADADQFQTVVLDHASGLADMILRDILGLSEIPAQKSWGLATQQQYGQQAMQAKQAFQHLLNLPTHVVIIAQQRTFGEESQTEDLKPTVGAALSPSVVGWLNPACDYVVQTFKRSRFEEVRRTVGGEEKVSRKKLGGVEYCMRVEPHETYMTKFRIPGGVTTDIIVDPTFDKVNNLIHGKEI